MKHDVSKPYDIITHADRSRGGGYYLRLSVYLSAFPHDISKPIQLGLPNLFHDEWWKPVYFGVKRLRSTSRVTNNIVGLCTLWVLASSNLGYKWRFWLNISKYDYLVNTIETNCF